MSIGAINQLIINNERPDIFTDNPSITFFKPNYRKYVNFAKTEQQYQLPNISFGSSVEFNLPKTDYINNIILSVLLPEISGKFKRWTKRQVKKKLEEYGVCISIKSACTVTITPSRIVMSMTHDRKRAFASWRISLSHLVTEEDIDKFLEIFDKCYKKMM